MGNVQLKPPFNLHRGVDAAYIISLIIRFQLTEITILLSFFREIDKYNKVIADVRYEKEEKYGFLDTKQQFVFIKPLNYEI